MTEILLTLIAVIAVFALIRSIGNGQSRTNYNITPLHDAAAHGNAETVTALLKAGANAKAITEEGKTAFDLAKDNSRLTVNLNGTEALQRLKNAAQ